MIPIHYAQQIAYSSKDVLMFTYEMAEKYCGIDSCYVECGIGAGAQIIALRQGCLSKIIYALDSFEGLPLPSNKDDQMPGIAFLTKAEQRALPDPGKQALISSGAVAVSEDDFWDHLYRADCPIGGIFTVKGWFEETLLTFNPIKPISILRLDGDLYNSTWVCLQHLFPKVIQGGCVIIDDWTLQGCQDACKEYFELIGYNPDYKFLDGTAYFFK